VAAHLWSIHAARGTRPAAARPAGLAFGVVSLCWLLSAGVYIAAKWVAADLPPWTLCFWRVSLAALLLLPIVWGHRRQMRDTLRARGAEVLLIGGTGLCLSQGFIYTGLHTTTAVNAGLIMALMPMLTMILARFMLGEPMGIGQALGSLIALFGMVVIVARGDLVSLLSLKVEPGELWIVGSAACFALYGVLLRRAGFALDPLPLLELLLCAAVLVSLPLYLWEIIEGERTTLDTSGLLALAYVAAPGGALMYYLFNWSVGALGAAKAGSFLYLQTVFVAILAHLLLGEQLYRYHFEGAALIVVGIALVTLMKPRAGTARAGVALIGPAGRATVFPRGWRNWRGPRPPG
jgi:drug/metabolite transporter (DMT)-like permease